MDSHLAILPQPQASAQGTWLVSGEPTDSTERFLFEETRSKSRTGDAARVYIFGIHLSTPGDLLKDANLAEPWNAALRSRALSYIRPSGSAAGKNLRPDLRNLNKNQDTSVGEPLNPPRESGMLRGRGGGSNMTQRRECGGGW